jgi:hypothetical protein
MMQRTLLFISKRPLRVLRKTVKRVGPRLVGLPYEPNEAAAVAVAEPETDAERMRRIRRERAEARERARFIVSIPLDERKDEDKQIESRLHANELARKEADAAAKRDAVTRQVRWKSGNRSSEDVANIVAAQERDKQGRRVRPEGTGRMVDGAHDDSSENRGRGVLDRADNTPVPMSTRPFSVKGIGDAGGVDPDFLESVLEHRRIRLKTPWGATIISARKEFHCLLCGFTETWARIANSHIEDAVAEEEQVFKDTLRRQKWDREVWDEFLADNPMPQMMPVRTVGMVRGPHAAAFYRFRHPKKEKVMP